MDSDLNDLSRGELIAELVQLRKAVRTHRDSTGRNGMVMLGSVTNEATEFGLLVKQPDEVGGTSTQSVYLVVVDADAVYASAKAGGARIAMEIRDEDYGGRGFSCHDLEGHLWSFGTYDPW